MNTIIGNTNYRELKDKRYIDSTAANIEMLAKRLTEEKIRFSGRINDYKATITVDGDADKKRAEQFLTDIMKQHPEVQREFIGNTQYRYIPQKRTISCTAAEARYLNERFGSEGKVISGIIDGENSARVTVSGDENMIAAKRCIDEIKYADIIAALKNRGYEFISDNSPDASYITVRDTKNSGAVAEFDTYDELRTAFGDMNNDFFNPTVFRVDRNHENYYIFAYDADSETYKGVVREKAGAVIFATAAEATMYARSRNIALANTAEEMSDFARSDSRKEKDRLAEAAARYISSNNVADTETHITFSSGSAVISYYNSDGNDGKGQFVETTVSESDVMNAYLGRLAGEDFFDTLASAGKTVLIDSDSEEFMSYAQGFIAERNSDAVIYHNDDPEETMTAVNAVENRFDTVRAAKEDAAEQQRDLERIADIIVSLNSEESLSDDMKLAEYSRIFNFDKDGQPAFENYYDYDNSLGEKENLIASFADHKTAWIDMWVHDYPVASSVREVSRLIHDYNQKYDHGAVLSNLTEQINFKKREIIALTEKGDFKALSAAVTEISDLQTEADRLKEELQNEPLSVSDVNMLRSIQPSRKSVQNMLDNEVAQVPRFEKQQREKMGEKSAFEMRQSDNEWRNDDSLTVPVIHIDDLNTYNVFDDMRNGVIKRDNYINSDTNMVITVGRPTIEETYTKARQDEKRGAELAPQLAPLYKIGEIIDQSICFDTQISEHKKKSPNSLFVHRLYSVFEYNKQLYLANLAVDENYNTNRSGDIQGTLNRLYNLRSIKITPVGFTGFHSHDLPSRDGSDQTDVTTISISQLYDLVKTYDTNFFENPDAVGRAEREEEIQLNRDFEQAMDTYNENVSEHIRALNIEVTESAEKTADLNNELIQVLEREYQDFGKNFYDDKERKSRNDERSEKADILEEMRNITLSDEQCEFLLGQKNALDTLYIAMYTASEYDLETAVTELFDDEKNKPIKTAMERLDTLERCRTAVERANNAGSIDFKHVKDERGGYFTFEDVSAVIGLSAGGEYRENVLSAMNVDLAGLAADRSELTLTGLTDQAVQSLVGDVERIRDLEKLFMSEDFVTEYVKNRLSWDDIESLGDIFFDDSQNGKAYPDSIFGTANSDSPAFTGSDALRLSELRNNGEDISEELVKFLSGPSGYDAVTRYTVSPINISFDKEYTENGIRFTMDDLQREVSYKELADSYLGLFERQYNADRSAVMADDIKSDLRERFGLELDFESDINSVILETRESVYLGGVDNDGHERKDNITEQTKEISFGRLEQYADFRDFLRGFDRAWTRTDDSGFSDRVSEYEMYMEIRDFVEKSVDDPNLSLAVINFSGSKSYPVIKEPEQETSLLDRAMNAINDFCVSEYSSEADFSDMSNVNIAYTTIVEIANKPLADELELQVSVDLENYAINSYVDGDLIHSEMYDSIEAMLPALNNLDFNELTSMVDFEDEIQSKLADKKAERAVDINEALADPIGSPEDKSELRRELDNMSENIDKQMPIFTESVRNLSDEELKGYFASADSIRRVGEAVYDAVSANNPELYHYDISKALEDVLDKFSEDKVAFVLAKYIDNFRNDGRISGSNIEWADSVLSDLPETAKNMRYVIGKMDQIHAIVNNDLVRTFRDDFFRDRKINYTNGREQDEIAEKSLGKNYDDFSDINAAEIRENLKNDPAKSPFVQQVIHDAENASAQEADSPVGNGETGREAEIHRDFDGKLQNFSLVTYSDDSGIDEKPDYAALDEAVRAGKEYVSEGYDGFAVLNRETKKIEHVEGYFPLGRGFNNEILRVNGYNDIADEKEKAARSEEEASVNKKSADDIVVGDRFMYRGKEYTVTSMQGIYPDDVGVSYWQKDTLHMTEYEVTSNFDKFILADCEYLGNVNDIENDMPEPKINDIISYDDEIYRVADISDSAVTLVEADSFLPDTRYVLMQDFIAERYEILDSSENEEFSDISEKTAADEQADTDTHDALPAEEDISASEEKSISSDKENNVSSYTITDEHFGEATPKVRYANNVAAIKALKTIEAENRNATPEEQEILAKYTGWGAIPMAFDENNISWKNEYAELREILTPEEYSAARHSTMNAHYTSPVVINAIYDGLKNLGFDGGKILEPAVGIGNFFGAMPENIRSSSRLTGVELDSMTGRIAQQLYPNADIKISGFEKTSFTDNSFDAAVGNVPFGSYKLNEKRYNENNFFIHDHFFAKALDKVHPGGVVAFVTSHGTLDKENDDVRKYLAQRAELLGAIRLPNNAFKANAGTEVTSDIIFLQKRERPIEIDPDKVEWLKKSENADGLSINNYFVLHPEMVLGKIVEGNKMYGSQNGATSCVPIEGADLKEQLAGAVSNIRGKYKKTERRSSEKAEDVVPAPANSRKFSYYAVEGNLYFRAAEDTMTRIEPTRKMTKDMIARALAMIEIRDNVHELLNYQIENSDGTLDPAIAESRERLNRSYEEFVGKYGNISDKKNQKAFKNDDGYRLISALELKDQNGKVVGKADIFTKDTIKPKEKEKHAENADDALILSVSERGGIDFDYMTEISGIGRDDLIAELVEKGEIFRLPQEKEEYVTADEYLTGNIRKKLSALDNAPAGMDISKHRAALEAAMPPRVEAKDIAVRLGSSWIPPKYIRDFLVKFFNPNYFDARKLNVEYSKVSGTWDIEAVKTAKNNYQASSVYGTERKNAYDIVKAILNNGSLQIRDHKKDEYGVDIRDSKGNYVLVLNEKATKEVNSKAEMIKREFEDWIFADPDRRNDLVEIYNSTFNSIRTREYDGSHLNFVGMNSEITLKEHQKNAVARALYGGNTLLAHAVGAGKSFEMIAIAMEGKRLGLHNKSMFAVPNSLTEQMGNDFRRLYPNANILVASEDDFKKDKRQELFAKIAANDWDAVIVGHSQFDRMGLSKEREIKYLSEEINLLRRQLVEACAANDKSYSVKQIEAAISRYEDKLEKTIERQDKEDFIDFEQMGCNKLFVDECHMYKNLTTSTKMSNVAGIAVSGSARAMNLLMKTKYLDELTGGKGCCFASGTPVSNSMTELYTMMRYLQSDTLKDMGIEHFDEWASTFGQIKTDFELKPESDGKYQLKTRFASFTNIPELMSAFKECADIRTADTLDLEKPKANVHEAVAKPSKIQKRAIKELAKRAANIRSGGVDPSLDNMLKITNDGRKIGLDQRLLNPMLPDDPGSKVNLCINNVFEIYQKNSDKSSTQMIFCDMSTPKSESRQDRFIVYRPDEKGYGILRKKTGFENMKNKGNIGYPEIKNYVDKAAKDSGDESDKLRDGDIIVIRRPSEDMSSIVSEAAVYRSGGFETQNSEELLDKFEMSPIEDMPPKEFNIYDDIKNKLIEKGVPEKEIAFIHDYDTAEKKQKLFNQMNAGEVRVLLGSTAKCGAGMNAQAKMIALHHLDAPMRPSDMEQRTGRIERQGNENKEVDIYRYVTDKTFDSYLYQLLENKQRFISQVMTSKTPERVCSDIDEQALDYAEVKALCAGNPLILEQMQIQNTVKELRMEKSMYNEKVYDLQDRVRIKIPSELNALESAVRHYRADFRRADDYPKVSDTETPDKMIFGVSAGGKMIANRKEGGEVIKKAFYDNISRLGEGRSVDNIGEYRGMKISIMLDPLQNLPKVCLSGEKNYYCEINLNAEGHHILTRLDNCIDNIKRAWDSASEKINTLKSELEQMKADIEKPFPKTQELSDAESKLAEIMDKLTKFELSDDTVQKETYERVQEMFPDIISGKCDYIRCEAGEGFMPLHISLQDDVLSVSHTYEQNNDLMYDPRIEFKVDRENEKIIPLSYENSGLGKYEEFDIDAEPTPESVRRSNDVIEFMDSWLDNIEDQGYSEVKRRTGDEKQSISDNTRSEYSRSSDYSL